MYAGSAYSWAIHRAGAMPLMVPVPPPDADLTSAAECVLARVDGLLLTGGGGAKIREGSGLPPLAAQQPRRYRFENILINRAAVMGIPIMGICRGHQMIAEVLGGSTRILVPPHAHLQEKPSWEPQHVITVESGSLLSRVCGNDPWEVTSFHRQAVGVVPPGFRVSAFSKDGVIEAIEALGETFIVGLQFHPEYRWELDERSRILFKAFVTQCRRE